MTADDVKNLLGTDWTDDDATRVLAEKIPTWSTSISEHVLDCKCLCEIRFGDVSIQEFHEFEDMHQELRDYFKKIEKETEIRKAALKYDC